MATVTLELLFGEILKRQMATLAQTLGLIYFILAGLSGS